MQKKRATPWSWIILTVLVVGFVGFVGLIFIGLALGGGVSGQVGLINFYGAIADKEKGGLFSAPGPRDFIADCDAARRDDTIKAVVIRINSPGGSAAASQEMYRAIRRLRETKPVVCSMGDVAASGGYYMAAACDKIYANPSTITASIGVVSQFLNMEGLFKKIGIDDSTLTSGRFKDAGSPFRSLRPAERQLFQAMIRDIYNQFVDDVVSGRKAATKGRLTRSRLLKIADGRVVTGRQAKNFLLVDELGGLREAVEAAGKLGGIQDAPRVREISGGGGLDGLLGGETSTPSRGLAQDVSSVFQGLGSAFAHGFAQTFTEQMKQEASNSARPQTR